MATVHYYTYHCHCGNKLISNADIKHLSETSTSSYIFVSGDSTPAYCSARNIARCNACESSLGGWFFLNDQLIIRLVKHRINRCKNEIAIYQLRDGETKHFVSMFTGPMKRWNNAEKVWMLN